MTTRSGIIIVCCCSLALSALANPVSSSGNDYATTDSYVAKLTSTMDELNGKESIGIYGNMISLEKMSVEEQDAQDESRDDDPLMSRIDEFLRSRRLQIRFPSDGSSADFFGRALGEKQMNFELRGLIHGASEGRTKIKRILLPLLLALKLKAIIVLPIVITLIGLIGIKGLGAGLLALLLSGAVALKALLTPSAAAYPTRISYARPYDLAHHEHWHRSQEEQLVNQPYRAWSPEIGFEPQFNPYPDVPV